jgi:hypothetical protein
MFSDMRNDWAILGEVFWRSFSGECMGLCGLIPKFCTRMSCNLEAVIFSLLGSKMLYTTVDVLPAESYHASSTSVVIWIHPQI